MNSKRRSRLESSLTRLKNQLSSGVKTAKKSFDKKVELTDKDKKRINKEIQSIQTKLKGN